MGIKNKYAIVGIGETKTGKLPEFTTYQLHLEAIKKAMVDAGLKNTEIDGLLTNQPLNDPHRCYAVVLASAAGIKPTYMTDLALGGATPVAMAQHAVMALEAGLCHTVVCVHARKEKTAGEAEPKRGRIRNGDDDFEVPYGLIGAIAQHAAVAQRHMYEFGTTSAQLGSIAVAFRKHACLNAAARLRTPITIEEHQNSRWVVEPLRLLDCSLMSDGGGAFIVTSVERAKDLRKRPIYIAGMGQHHPHASLADAQNFTTFGGKLSSEQAYRMAGVTPKDMDFAEIYDCFTITALITLEDYGFCPKGEGGRWVQGGRIELGGELPVNTHGGLLSQDHVEGMLHVTEAVKQLRGDEVEPERQVPNAQIGIVSGHGGRFSMHSTLIVSNQPL